MSSYYNYDAENGYVTVYLNDKKIYRFHSMKELRFGKPNKEPQTILDNISGFRNKEEKTFYVEEFNKNFQDSTYFYSSYEIISCIKNNYEKFILSFHV